MQLVRDRARILSQHSPQLLSDDRNQNKYDVNYRPHFSKFKKPAQNKVSCCNKREHFRDLFLHKIMRPAYDHVLFNVTFPVTR